MWKCKEGIKRAKGKYGLPTLSPRSNYVAGTKKERKEKKQENFRYKVLNIWENIQGNA